MRTIGGTILAAVAADGKSHRLRDCRESTDYVVTSSDGGTWCVWNPGVERTPLCETLSAQEWRLFYGLEPFMRTPRSLSPGESREHVVMISVRRF